MSQDPFLELTSLAALGALDGEDLERFAAHERTCEACQNEVAEFLKVVERLPLALDPVLPISPLRLEVGGTRPRGWQPLSWALAAGLLLSLGLLMAAGFANRSATRELALQRDLASAAQDEARKAFADFAAQGEQSRRDASFATLARASGSRMVHLGGSKDAPKAGACVVWNPTSREAMLMATALAPAPKDKAYEVWVIAGKSPTPAGTFQTDAGWKALVTLPKVPQLNEVETFAVTLEPSTGTDAPTGPIVLVGNVAP